MDNIETITKQLAEMSGQEIVQEVSDNTGRFSMFNSGSVECEVGEFLYALVRVMKPKRILETGTHKGWSATYMALALRHNKEGHLDTIEFEEQHINTSRELFEKLGLSEIVTIHPISSLDFRASGLYDIALLDTEPNIRFQELVNFEPFLSEGGIAIIHDLHSGMSQVDNKELGFGFPFGSLPQEMKDLIQNDSLRPISLPTPRGLTLFYKPRETDYKIVKEAV